MGGLLCVCVFGSGAPWATCYDLAFQALLIPSPKNLRDVYPIYGPSIHPSPSERGNYTHPHFSDASHCQASLPRSRDGPLLVPDHRETSLDRGSEHLDRTRPDRPERASPGGAGRIGGTGAEVEENAGETPGSGGGARRWNGRVRVPSAKHSVRGKEEHEIICNGID